LQGRFVTLDYEKLYEAHVAAAASDEEVVGAGDFDLIGAIELAALRQAGLRPRDVLVDLGCGTGRLALHAVPILQGGHYVGIEISQTILGRAKKHVAETHPDPPCQVTWLHNTETTFPLGDRSVDMVCAFSVFTHIEHEDTYRYLIDALRVVRPGGTFVFSCLPIDLPAARDIFVAEARLPLAERWRRVRSIATTRDLMDTISTLAGWRVAAWYGSDYLFLEQAALGQSVCALERPR
jgi:ubiquinone/menaquinone biosynthesis C-methylase UbiE